MARLKQLHNDSLSTKWYLTKLEAITKANRTSISLHHL